jgi:hypothetical protein
MGKLGKREIEFLRAIENEPKDIVEWGSTVLSRFKGYSPSAANSLWLKEMVVSTRTLGNRTFRITPKGRETLESLEPAP